MTAKSVKSKKFLTRNNSAPPAELQHYAQGVPLKYICKSLGRSQRTVTDWLNGTKPIPCWAIAVLRLEVLEHELKLGQMGIKPETKPRRTIDHRTLPAANDPLYDRLASRGQPLAQPVMIEPSAGEANEALFISSAKTPVHMKFQPTRRHRGLPSIRRVNFYVRELFDKSNGRCQTTVGNGLSGLIKERDGRVDRQDYLHGALRPLQIRPHRERPGDGPAQMRHRSVTNPRTHRIANDFEVAQNILLERRIGVEQRYDCLSKIDGARTG